MTGDLMRHDTLDLTAGRPAAARSGEAPDWGMCDGD